MSELHAVPDHESVEPPPRVELRGLRAADLPYVTRTYLDCVRRESSEHRAIGEDVFRIGQVQVLNRLLERSTAVVACLPGAPEVIVAWALFAPGVLHFIYVKKPFRRMGLAGELLAAAQLTEKHVYTTHSTILGRHLAGYFRRSAFNPYLR